MLAAGGYDEIPAKYSTNDGRNNTIVTVKAGDIVMVP